MNCNFVFDKTNKTFMFGQNIKKSPFIDSSYGESLSAIQNFVFISDNNSENGIFKHIKSEYSEDSGRRHLRISDHLTIRKSGNLSSPSFLDNYGFFVSPASLAISFIEPMKMNLSSVISSYFPYKRSLTSATVVSRAT